MTEVEPINITVTGLTSSFFSGNSSSIRLKSGDDNLVGIEDIPHFSSSVDGTWIANINVTGVFLGEFFISTQNQKIN